MRVLILGNSKSYENNRIIEEFNKENVNVTIIPKKELLFEIKDNVPFFKTVDGTDLMDFDVYIFRGMGKNIWEAMTFARYLNEKGKVIIEEKLATQRLIFSKFNISFPLNGIPVVDSKVIVSSEHLNLLNLEYPLIVKTTKGSRGRGVFKTENEIELKKYIDNFKSVLVQPYLPIKYDYRVFVVGDKVLGVMKRYNSDNNFLTNISAGGRAEKSSLPSHILDLCVKAKNVAKTEIAGVDVLEYGGKYYILEVNTSPQFQGFESIGINVASEIVKYAIQKFKNS